MSGGPTTTTDTKQSSDNTTSNTGTTQVTGTTLAQGTNTGQTYGLNTNASQSQGITGSAGYSANNAYAPTVPVLGSIIDAAGNINTGLTPEQTAAFSGLDTQAGRNATFNPAIESATNYMLSGAGFNDGDKYITEGYDAAKAALDPYASGYYLDPNNPELQAMLTSLEDQVTNSVGSTFADAGRSFSGAHANTLASGMTAAMAPTMLDWYTTEQANQLAAANSLASIGNAASGATAQNRAGSLSAMQGAPSMLSATIDPYSTMLTSAQTQQQIPITNLASISDIIMPMATSFGENVNLGGGYTSNAASSSAESNTVSNETSQQLTEQDILTMLESLGISSGTTTGSSTSTTEIDPVTALLGGVTMLGSAALGNTSLFS